MEHCFSMETLQQVARHLSELDSGAYFVGGAVRDLVVGRQVLDADVVVTGDYLAIAEELAKRVGGSAFELRRGFQTRRLAWEEGGVNCLLDLAPIRGALLDDLKERDYTLNAMALPVSAVLDGDYEKQVYDPLGGRQDLVAGRLRAVALKNLSMDPARYMRAVRLAADYNLVVEGETASYIRKNAEGVTLVAGERLREELFRALAPKQARKVVELMDNLGLLAKVLPQVKALQGLEQNRNHHLSAYDHTLQALTELARLLEEFDIAPDLAPKLDAYLAQPLRGASPRVNVLAFATLWHDVGKTDTATGLGEYGFGFPRHEEVGVELLAELTERLKFSTDQADLVTKCTRRHLEIHLALREERTTPADRLSFFRRTSPYSIEVILVSLVDRLAARGAALKPEALESYIGYARRLLRDYFERTEAFAPPIWMTGEELIEALGLEPGPLVSLCLEELASASAEGLVTSRDQALTFARGCIRKYQDAL